MPPKIDKISIYEDRRLGATINLVFDFLSESRSAWLRFVLVPLLLLSMVQATVDGMTMDDTSLAEMLITGFVWPARHMSYSLYAMTLTLGIFLTLLTTVALALAYHQRAEASESLTWRVMYPYLSHTLRRVWNLLPIIACTVVIMANTDDFLVMLAIVMLVLPFMLVCPVLSFESESVARAWPRAVGWGYMSWGQMLVLCAGMTVICFFLRSMAAIPSMWIDKITNMLLPDSQLADWLSSFITWLSDVLTCLMSYLTFSLYVLMYTLFYGSRAMRHRQSQVDDELSTFETLG